MSQADLPLRKTMCATCPWQSDSPTAFLLPDLTVSALTEATRICHCTGKDNAFHERTGLPEHICRGARDVQLQYFCSLGFLERPTDEEWNAKRVEMGMKPTVVSDPKKPQKKEQ